MFVMVIWFSSLFFYRKSCNRYIMLSTVLFTSAIKNPFLSSSPVFLKDKNKSGTFASSHASKYNVLYGMVDTLFLSPKYLDIFLMLYFENLSYLPTNNNVFLLCKIGFYSLNSTNSLMLVNLWLRFTTIKLEFSRMVSAMSSCTCLSKSTNTKS